MSIANNLEAARYKSGFTQEQLAAKAGMHVTQYNAYAKSRSKPSEPVLSRLATALGLNIEALIDGHELQAVNSDKFTATSLTYDELLKRFISDAIASLNLPPQRQLSVRVEII